MSEKKPTTPAKQLANDDLVITCDGGQISAVIAKAQRMNRSWSEPQKIAVDRWRIVLGPGRERRQFPKTKLLW